LFKDQLVCISLPNPDIIEKSTEVVVIWCLVELEITSIVQEDPERAGEPRTQTFNGGLLLFPSRLEDIRLALPWKIAVSEVDQGISKGFQIVASREFNTGVGVE
jgi:hypothetical protein